MSNMFYTKIAGTSHNNSGNNTENRQAIIRELYKHGLLEKGQEIELRAEPSNPYDRNAVAVYGPDGRQLGYLPKETASQVSHQLQQGKKFRAYVETVTGGDVGGFYGVNIKVENADPQVSIPVSNQFSNLSETGNRNKPKATLPEKDLIKGINYYNEQRFDLAFELLKKASDAGMAEAQYYLGMSYDFGHGVKKDAVMAFKLYKLAAEQGHAFAQGNLAYDYRYGVGTSMNDSLAFEWYKKSADQGNAQAMNGLGNMYTNGNGIDIDYEEGYRWFRKAAELGDREGMHNTGTALLAGRGVIRNAREAAKWNLEAAKLGQPKAQFNLAMQYLQGDGVQQDVENAIRWIRIAGSNGHPEAQRMVREFGL